MNASTADIAQARARAALGHDTASESLSPSATGRDWSGALHYLRDVAAQMMDIRERARVSMENAHQVLQRAEWAVRNAEKTAANAEQRAASAEQRSAMAEMHAGRAEERATMAENALQIAVGKAEAAESESRLLKVCLLEAEERNLTVETWLAEAHLYMRRIADSRPR